MVEFKNGDMVLCFELYDALVIVGEIIKIRPTLMHYGSMYEVKSRVVIASGGYDTGKTFPFYTKEMIPYTELARLIYG